LRGLLTAAACVLYQELRLRAARPAKSPQRIDITPRHRDTRVHDHQNQTLHE
jgi:hypothetical protein